jgi:general secretion pathway protein H
MVVVLIIVALASSLVFVTVGSGLGQRAEREFALEMAGLCKKARRMAVWVGIPQSFRISSMERRCWIEGAEGSLEVPEQMLIEGEGVARLDDDTYYIQFYPDGSSSGGELTLSVAGRAVYEFRVDMLTGLVVPEETG